MQQPYGKHLLYSAARAAVTGEMAQLLTWQSITAAAVLSMFID